MGELLTETARRLRALLPDYPDTYPVDPAATGPGWEPLDGVPVARWCTEARDRGGGHASVAAMAVGGALAHAVLGRVTAALVLDRRAWDLTAGNLLVHRAAAGHLDRVALRVPLVRVLAGDPAAGAPDARVFRAPDLLDALATEAVGTLDPLFAAVRGATRFGVVPLWNAAADTVRTTAAHVALYAALPPGPAHATATGLLDRLAARGARIRSRGADVPLEHRGHAHRVPVRASCCLWFRTNPPVPRRSDALCTTCPLLAPAERDPRYRAFLDGVCSSGSAR